MKVRVLLLLQLCGCLDINASGGTLDQNFERALPDLLRPGSVVIVEPETGGYQPQLTVTGLIVPSGEEGLYLDFYEHAFDITPEAQRFVEGYAASLFVDDTGLPRQGLFTTGSGFTHITNMVHAGRLWVLYCNAGPMLWAITSGAEPQYSQLGLNDMRWCGANVKLGAGATSETAVLFDGDEGELLITTLVPGIDSTHLDLQATNNTATTPGNIAAANVVWVEEAVTGTLSLLLYDGSAWRFVEGATDIVANAIVGVPVGTTPIHRTDAGLRIDTLAGLYLWDVDGAGTVQTLAQTPAPTINAAWEPTRHGGGALAVERAVNPLNAALTIAVAAQARVVVGDTIELLDVPTTMCRERDACRAIGESELRGVFGPAGQEVAIYDFWSWYTETAQGGDVRGVFAAPVR